jgi:hypothetical protein
MNRSILSFECNKTVIKWVTEIYIEEDNINIENHLTKSDAFINININIEYKLKLQNMAERKFLEDNENIQGEGKP